MSNPTAKPGIPIPFFVPFSSSGTWKNPKLWKTENLERHIGYFSAVNSFSVVGFLPENLGISEGTNLPLEAIKGYW